MAISGWAISSFVCVGICCLVVCAMYATYTYSQTKKPDDSQTKKPDDWEDGINEIKEIKLTKETNGNIITDSYVRFTDSGGVKDSPQPYEGYSRQWINDGVGKNGEKFVYPWTLIFDAGENHKGWGIKTIQCNLGGTQNPKLGLEVSDDGKTWKNADVPWMLKGSTYKKAIVEKRILNNKSSPWGPLYNLKSKGGWLFPFWNVTSPVTKINSRYIRFSWSSYQWMPCLKATGIDTEKGEITYENPGGADASANKCISGRRDGFPDPESSDPAIKTGVVRDPSSSSVGTASKHKARPINRTLGWNILVKKL